MTERKLLYITHYFPPVGGSAVQRNFSFAKYLPSFGWQPFVITAKNIASPMYDFTFLRGLPEECQVFRTPSLQPSYLLWWQKQLFRRDIDKKDDNGAAELKLKLEVVNLARVIKQWIFIPDDKILWVPFAVHTGVKVCKSENIDAILCSSPPYSVQVIGFLVSKLTGLPLISDLHDPWTQDPYFRMPTRFHKRLNNALERTILEHASKVIVICNQMKENLLNRYTNLQEYKIKVIPYGFAQEYLEDIQPINTQGIFTIAYVGALYAHHKDVFESFCKGLAKAVNQHPKLGENIQIVIVGRCELEIMPIIEKYNLKEKIFLKGYLPHKECLRYTMGANLLLLLIKEIAPSENTTITIPGKIFEYLASGNPIMMIGPQGDAGDIIKYSNAGIVIAPNDVDSIASELIRYFQLFTSGHLRKQMHQEIMQFERKELTKKLARELENILLDKSRGIEVIK